MCIDIFLVPNFASTACLSMVLLSSNVIQLLLSDLGELPTFGFSGDHFQNQVVITQEKQDLESSTVTEQYHLCIVQNKRTYFCGSLGFSLERKIKRERSGMKFV